jgi:hypothetical protein
MRPACTRRPRPRAPLAGALGLLLLPAAIGASSVAPAGAGEPAPPSPDRFVRLRVDPGSVVRSAEVGLPSGTTRLATTTYSMVAATWRGTAPRVAVRTAPGAAWQRLPPLEDGPSVGSAEGVPGLHGTDLVWTGEATDIDVRVSGTDHRDLELVLIEPGELASDAAAAAPFSRQRTPLATSTLGDDTQAPRPELRSRRDWGADNSWRNGRPHYNDRLKQVHVHHTATGNSYSRADVPGLIRGMYRYHTHSLGWFDIGYNFLVDRFGRAWVGRSGGPNRLVRGAHTLGFNHQSVGIAMVGTLDSQRPWRPAVSALVRLAAWKLDQHGRDALGKVRTTSTGSDKYRDGETVRLPVIDGHRDTNDTACPGQRLYDRLPSIRKRTQRRIDRF